MLAALAALQFIEEGLLKESDFTGLTTMQAQAVIEQARQAQNRRFAAARVHRLQAKQAEREARLAEERREEAEREPSLRNKTEFYFMVSEQSATALWVARHKSLEDALDQFDPYFLQINLAWIIAPA